MVTGTVCIDLTTGREPARNRVYFALAATPDAARVVVHVGNIRPALAPDAFRFMLVHVERVHIEVQGDAEAVRHWYRALTAGDLTLDVVA